MTVARAISTRQICSGSGKGTAVPSRVTKVRRRSPMLASATRMFRPNHATDITKVATNSRLCAPQIVENTLW